MVKNAVDVKPHVNGGLVLPNKLGNLCTIAVLRKQIMCDSLVLTKQYRAPLKAYTIEFPATVSSSSEKAIDLRLLLLLCLTIARSLSPVP